jgi:hypothetical protein
MRREGKGRGGKRKGRKGVRLEGNRMLLLIVTVFVSEIIKMF